MPYEIKSAVRNWRSGISTILTMVILISAGTATAGGYDRVGEASWYGKRYHGRTTANGESFDMNALTAAHKRLPFGTLVRVTNLANKRSLVVRINDRGPYAGGRIIDLSKRAASILGFQNRGVAKVRVQLVRTATQKERKYKKSKNIRKRSAYKQSAYHEKTIRKSLARSRPSQPITLRPPRNSFR